MVLFLSVDIHQGDERFSVHSRGKQCAFMSLSALLTAPNIPLNSWSSMTFKNALLQGDKMFLNALDSGFIILDPGVEFLSVENLPTVVNVACCKNLFNDFLYEICQTPAVQAKSHTALWHSLFKQKLSLIHPLWWSLLRQKLLLICPLWWSLLRQKLSLIRPLLHSSLKNKVSLIYMMTQKIKTKFA